MQPIPLQFALARPIRRLLGLPPPSILPQLRRLQGHQWWRQRLPRRDPGQRPRLRRHPRVAYASTNNEPSSLRNTRVVALRRLTSSATGTGRPGRTGRSPCAAVHARPGRPTAGARPANGCDFNNGRSLAVRAPEAATGEAPAGVKPTAAQVATAVTKTTERTPAPKPPPCASHPNLSRILKGRGKTSQGRSAPTSRALPSRYPGRGGHGVRCRTRTPG